MKLPSLLLCGAIAFAAGATAGLAQDYPERNLNYIVPFDAGGQTDIASRVFADALAGALGKSIAVVNRGGAGGAVGTAEIAAAEADGYTVGITTSTPMIQTPNRSQTPYTLDSFEFVCRVYSNPMIMVVKAESPYKSVSDVIEAAKGGTRITYGSVGTGSVQHVAMMQLEEQAGFKATQVQSPSDADAVRNVLADVTAVYFVAGSVYKQNADTLRPLAVMATEKLPSLPDTPTISELGYDVQAGVWGAFVAPKGVPEARVAVLRKACADAQETPKFIETLTGFGMEPVYMDGPETEKLAREQFDVAGRILKELGLAK